MTSRQLRARLARLEQSAKSKKVKVEERKLPFEFPIDPALAKAIKEDYDHLTEDYDHPWRNDAPEHRALRARIDENTKTITFLPSYGFGIQHKFCCC